MSDLQTKSVKITESPHCSRDPVNRARQLANLRPPWKPGDVPNPRGRPAAGAAIIELVNALQESSEEEVRKIADDATAPLNKRIAATRLLATLYADDPHEARKSASFVVDYTHGRPVQTQKVLNADGKSPEQLLAELRRKLGLPEDVDVMAVMVGPWTNTGSSPRPSAPRLRNRSR